MRNFKLQINADERRFINCTSEYIYRHLSLIELKMVLVSWEMMGKAIDIIEDYNEEEE